MNNIELEEIVEFIKKGLKPDNKIFEEGEDGVTLFERKIEAKYFSVFDVENGDYRIASVDGGSSIVLNACSFVVGVYQSAYSIFKNNRKIEDKKPKLKILPISLLNKDDIYFKEYFEVVGELPKKGVEDINWLVQRLRIFEEWKNVFELIKKLDKGDIIIYDGSLKADISLPDSLLFKVTKKAYDKGVILVGISKRSTMYSNHAPITVLVKKIGENIYPRKRWLFKVSSEKKQHLFGKTYIVKFNPLSRFVFRSDINILEKELPEKIFGKISNYCNDASYLGYPYPLAFIHNKVAIDGETIKSIRNEIQSIALKKGLSLYDWESLFSNFHDVLDKSF